MSVSFLWSKLLFYEYIVLGGQDIPQIQRRNNWLYVIEIQPDKQVSNHINLYNPYANEDI